MTGVVVGIDESKEAHLALEWALRYARHEHLPVTVVTVVDPLLGTALWDTDPARNDRAHFVNAARSEAEQIVRECETDDVDVSVRAVAGHPVKELVDAADGADLLVVGSHGSGRFTRLLLGSTSYGVAQHARCSVAIVHAPADAASASAPDA